MKYLVLFFLITSSITSFSQDFNTDSPILASEMQSKLNTVRQEKFIQRFTHNQEVTLSGSAYSRQTLFTLNNLDTNKKYRLISPTYLRYKSRVSGATRMYLDNKLVQYFYVHGVGYMSDKFDITFQPNSSSIILEVDGRYGTGLELDFNNEIALDLYEINEDNISLSSGDLIDKDQINTVLNNGYSKGELVETHSMTSSGTTNGQLIHTFTNLTINDTYILSIPYTRLAHSTCSGKGHSYLELGGKEITAYETPTDSYSVQRTEVEFIANNSNMELRFYSPGSCQDEYFNITTLYLYKKNPNYQNIPDGIIKASKLNEEINKSDKEDIFISNFSRSTNVIPSNDSTYRNADVVTLTGLTVGKTYRLRNPLYLRMRSGTSSAATILRFKGQSSYLQNTYSNAGSNDVTYHMDRLFTATATSMTLEVRARGGGGIIVDSNSQISFDVYEIVE